VYAAWVRRCRCSENILQMQIKVLPRPRSARQGPALCRDVVQVRVRRATCYSTNASTVAGLAPIAVARAKSSGRTDFASDLVA
jgi:hypothetical protein